MAKAIVVTGTPGTGKSTASKFFAASLGYQIIDVSELIDRERLYSAIDRLRGSKIANMIKVKKRLGQLIHDSPEGVVVEGHIADVTPREDVEIVIVLRLHPDELTQRLEGIGWSEAKVKENVSSEVLDVCLKQAIEAYGYGNVREIDTTHKSPNQVSKLMVQALDSSDRFKPGDVDWLQVMEEENKLEELFEK